MENKRIEYIDSLRGLTMVLVVYHHIQFYSTQLTDAFTFNTIFKLFRMPLFFFISGFILYKATTIWDLKDSVRFINKKIVVQLIPTFFFIILDSFCFDVPIKEMIFDSMKGGYWFTFTLFEFFIIYVTTQLFIHSTNLTKYENFILIFSGLIVYIVCNRRFINYINEDLISFFSISNWHLYIFFLFGCIVKKYFTQFKILLDSKYFIPFIQISFIFACLVYIKYDYISFFIGKYIPISGIIIVFAFFRNYEFHLSSKKSIGRILQFIGKRTLDIYLIHYFLLPRNLTSLKNYLGDSNPLLEFSISMFLALLVVGACLIISSIFRTSPILGHYLFGVKLPK